MVLTLLASLYYLSDNKTNEEILQRLEAIPYDIRLKLSTPKVVNDTPPIVIIDIDEASLKKDGRWPWSRKKIAKLTTKLSKNSTALIMMDVVHSEKEQNPTVLLKQALADIKIKVPDWIDTVEDKLDADSYFATTITDKEVVLGYPFFEALLTQSGKLPTSTVVVDTDKLDSLATINMLGYTANLKEFTNNAAGSGFFSISPDADGTIRSAAIIAKYHDQLYPSLALETARLYLLEDTINVHTANVKTITHVTLGKLKIPTDAKGQILIPYLGKKNSFNYISASEILHSEKEFPELENAIAIIGTSSIGLADLRPTPVEVSFPGVEIQANILHGLLHPESIAYLPDWTKGATFASLIFLGLLMMIIYPLLQPTSLVLFGISLFAITFSFNYWLWASQHINLPVIMSLLLIMAISSIYVIYDLLKENKDRRRIHDMFGQYVPRGHIDKLIDNPAAISTDGEKREMTVLFSDLRNFTSLSEPLSTRELKDFLNHYLTPITKIIFDKQGTIDKYVGDMVMAFWGAPLFDPKHAEQAVQSALDMQNKITQMQSEFSQLGIDNVAAGIGIHTGEMNVGDMGSDYRRAYTVLGDAVNLGSRLESLTKFYGIKILVSEDTRQQCPNIVFRYIDYVRVKGKQDAIKVYEPLASKTISSKTMSSKTSSSKLLTSKSNLSPEEETQLTKHEQAFEFYLKGNWSKARDLFKTLHQESQQLLYQVYLNRIDEASGTPPTGWDSIYTHHTK